MSTDDSVKQSGMKILKGIKVVLKSFALDFEGPTSEKSSNSI